MLRYIIKRLLMMIPVLLGVIILVFTIIHFMPGDPVLNLLTTPYTQEQYDEAEKKLGLDKSYWEQLGTYLYDFVTKFEFGTSYSTGRSVRTELAGRVWTSVRLGLMSCLLTAVIGIPIGVISAVKQNSPLDYTTTTLAVGLGAMPSYWLAIMAILLFSLRLGWLPATGLRTWKSYILPVCCNAVAPLAIVIRMTRSSMLEVIRKDYITTARAKGIRDSRVILRHALRNALIPIITVIGNQFSVVIGGSVIIESVFSINGMGTRLVQAISSLDYTVIMGITIIISIMVMIIMLLVDLLYTFVDPRIKTEFQTAKKGRKTPERSGTDA